MEEKNSRGYKKTNCMFVPVEEEEPTKQKQNDESNKKVNKQGKAIFFRKNSLHCEKCEV